MAIYKANCYDDAVKIAQAYAGSSSHGSLVHDVLKKVYETLKEIAKDANKEPLVEK